MNSTQKMLSLMVAVALVGTACTKKVDPKISAAVPATLKASPTSTPAPSAEVTRGLPTGVPPKSVSGKVGEKVAVIESVESIEDVSGPVSTDAAISSSSSSSGSSVETVNADFERTLDASVLAGHVTGLRDGVRSFTEVRGEIGYQVAPETRIGIGQSIRKLYDINYAGEEEFLFDDTRLFADQNLSKDFLAMNWDANLGLTLPTSQRSRDTRHITRATVGLTISKRFFSDAVCISYSPSANYYFNQYGTDKAGNPLKRISLAQLAQMEVKLFAKLGLNVWGRGYSYMYEEYDYASITPGPTNEFSYGSYLGYEISKTFGAQLGYVWGNTMLRNTQYEDNFYDSPTGRYYAAIEVRF